MFGTGVDRVVWYGAVWISGWALLQNAVGQIRVRYWLVDYHRYQTPIKVHLVVSDTGILACAKAQHAGLHLRYQYEAQHFCVILSLCLVSA